jgi:predicted GH43/DUF377 family glycosyl hydrolase
VSWELGPFTRLAEPLLTEQPALPWASKDLFNPGAVVRDGAVHLLVRGEDDIGAYAGTSRIGVARSDDGVAFEIETEPVLSPADDACDAWEHEGGCEDPRVVESPDGTYVCTYTGFNGRRATLMVATSIDLHAWVKHGPAFAGTPYEERWAKSGSIVTEVRDGRLVATQIDGRYWMYWGEGTCFAATSTDLVRWTPLEFDTTEDRSLERVDGRWKLHRVRGGPALRPVLFPRAGRFDSLLVEPGPPAVRTEHGIVLLYNGGNHSVGGDASLPPHAYSPGQALFDANDAASCIARATEPFLRPGAGEHEGQVGNVCFAQGLVLFRDEWRLYLGLADSRIGCATAPA